MGSVARETLEECARLRVTSQVNFTGAFCNATFDTILCWPSTQAGAIAKRHCPKARAFDTRKFATRRCGEDGQWLAKHPGQDAPSDGWTNFTGCYSSSTAKTLFENLYANKTDSEREAFRSAIRNTRALEVTGSCLSIVTLLASILIFCCFRSLRCKRTKIHVNLFMAMLLQFVLRLGLYIEQYVAESHQSSPTVLLSPIVCETVYSMVEYFTTVIFVWMFLEGFHLNSMVTFVTLCSSGTSLPLYIIIGWGVPTLLTITWAVTQGFNFEGSVDNCWYGYTEAPVYWIVQGPRVAIVLVNLILLLNVVRVLFTKLRNSMLSEAQQARKAIKAAFVLLPLLGITSIVSMTEVGNLTNVRHDDVIKFSVWVYTGCILVDFQGVYLSLLYCFLNGEVRKVIHRKITQLRYRRMSVASRGIYLNTQNSSIESRRGSRGRLHLVDCNGSRNTSQKPGSSTTGSSSQMSDRNDTNGVESKV